jgi:hypothetical protein
VFILCDIIKNEKKHFINEQFHLNSADGVKFFKKKTAIAICKKFYRRHSLSAST